MKVFLSHSSKDAVLAHKLAIDLKSIHIDVWLDQWQLEVGEEIAQSIRQGVDDADFVIVLLTPASVASEWVDREWRQKIHNEARNERIAIIPVRGKPCEIPDFLAQRSYADISGSSYPLGFRHLLEILRHYGNDTIPDLPRGPGLELKQSPLMIPVVTPISLEVSRELIPLFEPDHAGRNRFFDQLAPHMHSRLKKEFGFRFPGIRVRGNDTDMSPRSVLIMIDEVPEMMIAIGPENVLVFASIEQLTSIGLSGKPGRHPSSDQPCTWIARATDYAKVKAAGFETLDALEYITLVLEILIRRMASSFLDLDITRGLVEAVTLPERMAVAIPKTLPWIVLTDILRRLVDEEIGVGNMAAILTTLTESPPEQTDSVVLAEFARHALKAQITEKFTHGQDELSVFRLSSKIEDRINQAILQTSRGQYLNLGPQLTQNILAAIRHRVKAQRHKSSQVPIVTIWPIRRYVRKLVELEFPKLHVLAHEDLNPDLKLNILSWIDLQPVVSCGGQKS